AKPLRASASAVDSMAHLLKRYFVVHVAAQRFRYLLRRVGQDALCGRADAHAIGRLAVDFGGRGVELRTVAAPLAVVGLAGDGGEALPIRNVERERLACLLEVKDSLVGLSTVVFQYFVLHGLDCQRHGLSQVFGVEALTRKTGMF